MPTMQTSAEQITRSLEALDRVRLPMGTRKQGLVQKKPALVAAVATAEETYRRARAEAVQAGRPLPTREGIEAAQAAVRAVDQEIAGLDDALEALLPEHAAALNAQRVARRMELETQRAALQAEVPELTAAKQRLMTVEEGIRHLDELIRQS